MKNETIKMNIQILNIKTGTIKIKKQLTYTKTLQMALHNYVTFCADAYVAVKTMELEMCVEFNVM